MAKLTPSELMRVDLLDTKEENARLAVELKKKDLERLSYDIKLFHMNVKIKEYEKALQHHEIGAAERMHEDLIQARRNLLKELAKKHKVKTEVWGYDPLTGEIIEDNEE